MRCNAARPLLGSLQDGELSVMTAYRVRRHLRVCPDCTAEAAELSLLTTRLQELALFGLEKKNGAGKIPLWRRTAFSALSLTGLICILVLTSPIFKQRVALTPLPEKFTSRVKTQSHVATASASVAVIRPKSGWANEVTKQKARTNGKEGRGEVVSSIRKSPHPKQRRIKSHSYPELPFANARTVKTESELAPRIPQEEIIVVAARDLTTQELMQRFAEANRAVMEAPQQRNIAPKTEEIL